MKIGFSSMACPTWGLGEILDAAKAYGYSGVELRGLRGELYLPLAAELTADAEGTRRRFQDAGVELVCLGSSANLALKGPRDLAKAKAEIIEYMELAAKLGCPSVRVMAGEAQRGEDRQAAMVRVGAALASLTSAASRLNVSILVENGGDFSGSADLWFIVDYANHPLVRCCWNQCHAMSLNERKSNSLPRLSSRMGLVHICDGVFDADGVLQSYKLPGEGEIDIARQLDILKGLLYGGYLVFEWPRIWVDTLAGPETALPAAAKFMRGCIDSKQAVLSAYKGDKNAARMTVRPGPAVVG